MSTPSPRPIAVLQRLSPFLRPYRRRLVAATIALLISFLTVLLVGQGLRHILDQGLQQGDAGLLTRAVLGFIVVSAILAVASGVRFYLVSWIGERVVAD